ncbi:MAG: redoxin domain-containing protein [Pirellula sp.]|nr:redoxin domain-containing protein [Pirellula sp.]
MKGIGCVFCIGLAFVASMPVLEAGQRSPVVSQEYRSLVPHRLLALLHAPQVHEELGLSSNQVRELEAWFQKVDGPWFRSRILPPEKQLPEMDRLESETRDWMQVHFDSKQILRLTQLEWQSLGPRMLLRNDFARELNVTTDQQRQLAEIAKETDTAPKNGQQPQTTQRENQSVQSILKDEQRRRFASVVGATFDTQKLQRIYPMAPELVPTSTWFNSKPLTLESLRGKVVLVHFYAFQCHNCQANFNIYRRWHEKLQEKGVVVLGIQTPETPAERDPKAVCKAATDEKLNFPILIDLESKNWDAWGNTMWPTVYVVDKQGYIRHWWQGELNWQGATGDQTIEKVVDIALAESN